MILGTLPNLTRLRLSRSEAAEPGISLRLEDNRADASSHAFRTMSWDWANSSETFCVTGCMIVVNESWPASKSCFCLLNFGHLRFYGMELVFCDPKCVLCFLQRARSLLDSRCSRSDGSSHLGAACHLRLDSFFQRRDRHRMPRGL